MAPATKTVKRDTKKSTASKRPAQKKTTTATKAKAKRVVQKKPARVAKKVQRATKPKVEKPKAVKPITPEDNEDKKRHFYVYYNDKKLEGTRLSGWTPRQAANKAITAIINYELKEHKKDLKGEEIKFYIVETGRKRYKRDKEGRVVIKKGEKVELHKRKFYYIGKKVHIPEDPKDKYYEDKKITKGQNAGKTRHMDLKIVNGKVEGIIIKKKDIETDKLDDNGKVVMDENGKAIKEKGKGDVIYSYITTIESYKPETKEEEKKQTKAKKPQKDEKKEEPKKEEPKKEEPKKEEPEVVETAKKTTKGKNKKN